MKKRWKLLCLVTFVVLSGVVVLSLFNLKAKRGPSYAGKTLSEWLEVRETNPAVTAQKADAIGHIGTNAVPYLLQWIQYEQPNWKFRLYNSYSYHMKRPFPIDRYHARAWAAAYGFRFLGRHARGAVPELRRLAIDQKPGSHLAMCALACLGSEGRPAIIEALSSKDKAIRAAATRYIPEMGTNALPVIPLLIELLKQNDSDAAYCLGELQLDREDVVSALVNSLQSSNANERAIAHALGNFGSAARPAVPALLGLLNHPYPSVRDSAAAALFRIAPETLTNTSPSLDPSPK